MYTKDERVAALLKQRNPAYTYNTVAATAIWLNYLSKYSDNKGVMFDLKGTCL